MSVLRSPLLGALLFGTLIGVLGPQLGREHDRPANAPFVYRPPSGFVSVPERTTDKAETLWTYPTTLFEFAPKASLSHTANQGLIDQSNLASLAGGMPGLYAHSNVTWREIRHEVHVRPDGALVGLIEGECTPVLTPGEAKPKPSYRSLAMAFPDDAGTSMVIASFPLVELDRWEKDFATTMDDASGVAVRASPPPGRTYGLWALAGAVVGAVFIAVARRRVAHS